MDDSFLGGVLFGVVALLVFAPVAGCTHEQGIEKPRDELCQRAGYEEHVTWDDSHWCVRYAEGTIDSGEIQQYRLVTNEAP